MRSPVIAHAPTRLDFGGGWTDVPPYPEERGGFVCNIAIERRATVRLSSVSDATAARPINQPDLVRAACRHAGIENLRVDLESDFPVGAGLGGSSAAGVALAAALAHWNGELPGPHALAEWSREVEVSGLQMAGGRQDYYAAALGGALALTFESDVTAKALTLTEQATAALERRALLLYTGESRISGETITAVLDAYKERNSHVLAALERMKALAIEMAQSLEDGNIDTLGALVGEHWEHQRSLHPKISTPRIDAIHAAAHSAGAIGMKALGASGGGCVLIVTRDENVEAVRAATRHLGEELAWRVARTGVQVLSQTIS